MLLRSSWLPFTNLTKDALSCIYVLMSILEIKLDTNCMIIIKVIPKPFEQNIEHNLIEYFCFVL